MNNITNQNIILGQTQVTESELELESESQYQDMDEIKAVPRPDKTFP